MYLEQTSNGIPFSEDIVSSQGASFILYCKGKTKAEITKAKAEIRFQRDVVSMNVADENDYDELYKSQVFKVPATRPLKWYEIEQDEKLLRRERLAGTSPEDFVKTYVLPFTEQVKKQHYEKFGEKMFQL